MSGVRVLAGTRKGLFQIFGDSSRTRWRVEGPTLAGWAIFHAMVDAHGTLLAAANHLVYGPTIQRSHDNGSTWNRSPRLLVPVDPDLALRAVWHIETGGVLDPDTLYLGGDPALLFRSDDGGESWQLNEALASHATRGEWRPGAGGLCCHSIQVDPRDSLCMLVGISAAGTFRTDDGGLSWRPLNAGVEAGMLETPYPDIGQCVHKLLAHPARPDRLWQANHCGVYRSDDLGETWDRVDGNGLPSEFNFTLMLDPLDPDVALVIPEESYEYHYTSNGRLGVYRTQDAGTSWHLFSGGLPEPAWDSVLREASAFDAESAYFGTLGGSLYALGPGDRWVEAISHLPPILSVEVTPWSA